MYSLAAYGEMLGEPVRRRAYLDALKSAIRPDCVVLEIGTGPGIYALLAAREGAGKVHAVEPDDSVHLARQLAAVNGLGERVEFHQCLSTELDLPAKADLVVSDLRGVLPLFKNHLPSIIDARERLLAPGGQLIPQEDSLWASVVSDVELYSDLTRGWRGEALGLDLSLPLGMVTCSWRKAHFSSDQCLVEPRRWAVLDYRCVAGLDVSGRLSWEVSRAGPAHGLAIWFDTVLAPGIGFSNAPGEPELIYGQGFFPFTRPIELRAGERVELEIAAIRTGLKYVWRWVTTVRGRDGDRLRFDQSTFHGVPLSPARLRKRASNYVPELAEDGQVTRFILEQMDGQRSLEAIARELHRAFPERFESWRQALKQVGDLAEAHS